MRITPLVDGVFGEYNNLMPFITQGKTNYLYISFVAAIAIIASGLILGFYYFWIIELEARITEIEAQLPVVKSPEEKEGQRDNLIIDLACDEIDEETGWKICKSEKYEFELRYPSDNWEQCEPFGKQLFCLVGKELKGQPTPYSDGRDRIFVSLEPEIFGEYSNYIDFKTALEKALLQSNDELFPFVVFKIEEILLGGEKVLVVTEEYAIGSVNMGMYVFHNQNLFRISYDDVFLNRREGENKEISQILSTFKLLD